MSGVSYDRQCPKCEGINLMCYSDWKPFDSVQGECLDCGFHFFTQTGQLSLEEVNERREDYELKELKKLKKQVNQF